MLTRSEQTRSSRYAALAAFVGSAILATGASAGVDWTPWAVGTGSTVDAAGQVTFTAGSASPQIVWASGGGRSGNKAIYSTDDFNGRTIGSLDYLSYTMLTGAPTPDTLQGPYLNIFVTDGIGGFAQLLLDASPAVPGDLDGQAFHDFQTAHYAFGEAVGGLSSFTPNVFYNYDDVKNLTIFAGPYAGYEVPLLPSGGYCAISPAGCDDGMWLAWGNKSGGAQYADPVVIADVTVVPEPGTLALLGLGLAGLALRRRKAAA